MSASRQSNVQKFNRRLGTSVVGTRFKAALRSPNWSRDGQTVIYEKLGFRPRTQNRPLYSWDPEWEYRHTDVFPVLTPDGKLVITEKSMNSSIAIMDPDGSNSKADLRRW